MQAFGDTVNIFPIGSVPIELLDTIGGPALALERSKIQYLVYPILILLLRVN